MATKEIVPAKDVEVVNPGTGEIITVKGWAAVVPRSDNEDFLAKVVEHYLAAETLDALLTIPEGTGGLRDYVGKVVTIHDARWGPSAFKSGPGCFYLLDITAEGSNEHVIVTTGATNIIAVVAKAFAAGWLPFSGRVVEVQSNTNPENKIQYLVSTEAF